MPRPAAAPKANRRISLFEKINHIRLTYDQQEISEWLQQIDEKQKESIGFRWAAEKTQKRQDRILATYQAFLQAEGKINEESTDQEKDQICFPLDHGVMMQQIRRLVLLVANSYNLSNLFKVFCCWDPTCSRQGCRCREAVLQNPDSVERCSYFPHSKVVPHERPSCSKLFSVVRQDYRGNALRVKTVEHYFARRPKYYACWPS